MEPREAMVVIEVAAVVATIVFVDLIIVALIVRASDLAIVATEIVVLIAATMQDRQIVIGCYNRHGVVMIPIECRLRIAV